MGNTEGGFFLDIREIVNISERIFLVCCKHNIKVVGRDIAVGIATGIRMDGPGIESRWGARFSAPVQTGTVVHPASCTMDTGSFPGVKRLGRGVDHPPHLAPRLKKE